MMGDLDEDKAQLDELYYSDLMPDHPIEEASKKSWLQTAYGDLINKSQPKTYLLKLVEYNKIEIIENDSFLMQTTEIEIVMCRLMKSRLINDELKHELETYSFQGILAE